MYHIFSTHSSIKGHLGCFRVSAIVNNTAVNMGVHTTLEFSFSFDKYPEVQLLDRMVVLFLTEELPYCFSVVAPIYIPANSA